MFAFYEGDSIFHRMNPTFKLAAVGFGMILLTFSFDPFVPAVLFITVLVLARSSANIPIKAMMKGLLPFFFLGLGFLWMHLGFSRANHEIELFSIGSFTIYQEALIRGGALFFRVNAYAAFSLFFVATTNPTELLLSLMQQAKVSPLYGYSILAAYRFFPLYQSEFQILKEAHQVRGLGLERGIRHRFRQLKRFAIPLLAQAIRKAERVAIAMEARSFNGQRKRNYYHRLHVTRYDWLLALVLMMIVPIIMIAAYQLGFLIIWEGGLFF